MPNYVVWRIKIQKWNSCSRRKTMNYRSISLIKNWPKNEIQVAANRLNSGSWMIALNEIFRLSSSITVRVSLLNANSIGKVIRLMNLWHQLVTRIVSSTNYKFVWSKSVTISISYVTRIPTKLSKNSRLSRMNSTKPIWIYWKCSRHERVWTKLLNINVEK